MNVLEQALRAFKRGGGVGAFNCTGRCCAQIFPPACYYSLFGREGGGGGGGKWVAFDLSMSIGTNGLKGTTNC